MGVGVGKGEGGGGSESFAHLSVNKAHLYWAKGAGTAEPPPPPCAAYKTTIQQSLLYFFFLGGGGGGSVFAGFSFTRPSLGLSRHRSAASLYVKGILV